MNSPTLDDRRLIAKPVAASQDAAAPQLLITKVQPEPARTRRIVLTSEFYQSVVSGQDNFLIRPIMNILGKDLRPVPTRARAQGGAGGLLWAFFPGSINADAHLLRSCPYGDPGDKILMVTQDHKDLPLAVTVLESYPHRVLGTTDKFMETLIPSYWARLGSVQNFYDHWQRSFGRVFKLTYEPWAWVIRFASPPKPTAVAEFKPETKQSLFGRWRHRRREKEKKAEEPSATPQLVVATAAQAGVGHEHQQLVAAQNNALACLENAIKARREGRADEGWRMMNVAYRILTRAAKDMD
jgi:hypothetical protein